MKFNRVNDNKLQIIISRDDLVERDLKKWDLVPYNPNSQRIFQEILEEAISYGVAIIGQDEIDEINILNATKKALTDAINQMEIKPERILVDALDKIETNGIPYTSVIKGDAKMYSIGAASIIAKVTRDRIMREYDEVYPDYGFAGHKGYGTAKHIEAIKSIGICPLHRRSFVKNFERG